METSHWDTLTRGLNGRLTTRWRPGEEEQYIALAIEIGNLATSERTGVRRLLHLPAMGRSPQEIGDLVAAQNPDVDVSYPWREGNVPSDDDTYPFQVQRRSSGKLLAPATNTQLPCLELLRSMASRIRGALS